MGSFWGSLWQAASGRCAGGVACVLLALAVAGCSGNTTVGSPQTTASLSPGAPDGQKKGVKVAMLLPLSGSGQTAIIAKAMKQAGELALFERDSQAVQLLVKDDKGTPDGAMAAAVDSVRDGADLVLGPLFAKSVTAAAPAVRSAKVAMIAFSTDRQVAGHGVHLLSFLPGQDVRRVIDYAASQGRKRYVALIAGDTTGKISEGSFREAVARNGGTIVALESYAPASRAAIAEAVQRVRDVVMAAEQQGAPVDAVFLPGDQDQVVAIAPMLVRAGIDLQRAKLIGTGGLEAQGAAHLDALAGAWYAGPDPRGWNDFAAKFSKTYGYAPPRIASQAFDAVSLAIALAGASGGARIDEAQLSAGGSFTGVDGSYRLLADGTTERALAVFEVRKGSAPAVVSEAPASFGAAPVAGAAATTASALGSIFN